MNIKDLKNEVNSLSDISKTLDEFKVSWIRPVKKHATNKLFQTKIKQLRHAVEDAKEGQIINQKLKTLAHHLVDLRITTITNDHKTRSLVMHRFLHDPFLHIKQLITDVNNYERQVQELQQLYTSIHHSVTEMLPLEDKISILDSHHQFTFQNILQTVQKQKQLLKLIGTHFLKETRALR